MNSSFGSHLTNPFSTDCISPSSVVYRFAAENRAATDHAVDAHLENLLSKLRECRLGAIIGPHGTGKSTLLHTFLPKLQHAYPQVAFHQLCHDPRDSLRRRFADRVQAGRRIRAALSSLPAGGLLVVDGWEQLGRLSRWWISRSSGSNKVTLLVTAHHRPAGFTVIHETAASSQLVRALAKELTKDSPYRIQKMVDDQIKSRRVNLRTNVRDLWFEMYDLVEESRKEANDGLFGH
ncbi:hypothetical protein FYK55_17585 [Roseiconus nitratireducens]|uniref:AAA+ ATPase domain-containing protein n=1 Tax=Roseiconus nitratireducens TaxID=2605748 RepID=A0A5M6D224_9BACT|nr:hypothetical protein [Roseiconus nitratireducens]KAA5541383.1 hypothetical protein FYK55_17585 [Roseiconus nitratireducens]